MSYFHSPEKESKEARSKGSWIRKLTLNSPTPRACAHPGARLPPGKGRLPRFPSSSPARARAHGTHARAQKHARLCADKGARARAGKGARTHVGIRTHSHTRARIASKALCSESPCAPAPQLRAPRPRAPSSSPAPGSERPAPLGPAPPRALAPTHLAPLPARPGPTRAPSRRPRGQGAQPHGRPGARGELGPGQARSAAAGADPSPAAGPDWDASGAPAPRSPRQSSTPETRKGAAGTSKSTPPSEVRCLEQKPGERAHGPRAPLHLTRISPPSPAPDRSSTEEAKGFSARRRQSGEETPPRAGLGGKPSAATRLKLLTPFAGGGGVSLTRISDLAKNANRGA